MYDKALALATQVHVGQLDKSGQPYINHLLVIASSFDDEIHKTIALLHGIMDNTAYTRKELKDMGFINRVVSAVDFLTKRENQSYRNYLNRVLENEYATRVKIADLKRDMDIIKLECMTDKDITSMETHRLALKYLERKSLIGIERFLNDDFEYENNAERMRFERIENSVVWADDWEFECCPHSFAIGGYIEWLVIKSDEWCSSNGLGNPDYYYHDHCGEWERMYVIVGEVTKIEAYYLTHDSKGLPRQGKGSKIIKDVTFGGDGLEEDIGKYKFYAYSVSLQDVYVAPARKSDVWFS